MGSFVYSVVVVFVLTWGVSQANGDYWSYFVFTQQWPRVACMTGNATKDDCQIPANVTTWTIHGLWPTDPKHEGPFNCNSTWKFHKRQIRTLEDRLKKFWPSLNVDSAIGDELWAHEWTKHGTCCTNLKATANETLYFSKGLSLNDKYNLTRVFEENHIFPNKTGYKLQQFITATSSSYKGYIPNIRCVKQTTGRKETQYIYEVQICLNQKFQVMNCSKPIIQDIGKHNLKYMHDSNKNHTGFCQSNLPVVYPIIHP